MQNTLSQPRDLYTEMKPDRRAAILASYGLGGRRFVSREIQGVAPGQAKKPVATTDREAKEPHPENYLG